MEACKILPKIIIILVTVPEGEEEGTEEIQMKGAHKIMRDLLLGHHTYTMILGTGTVHDQHPLGKEELPRVMLMLMIKQKKEEIVEVMTYIHSVVKVITV